MASPQGIAALAKQGGVATLTEGRDANILGHAVFLLTENEATQDARYFRQESIEVRPSFRQGFSTPR